MSTFIIKFYTIIETVQKHIIITVTLFLESEFFSHKILGAQQEKAGTVVQPKLFYSEKLRRSLGLLV